MADKDNDMSGAAARSAGEREAAARARRAALGDDNAPSADAIGEAVAKALARSASQPLSAQRLGDVVRASVRAGFEDVRTERPDGSKFIATKPRSITFSREETADGKEYTVVHGRPVHLKRDAFIARRDQGVVIIAE